jgi:abortive infection alpha-like protein
MPSGSSNGPSRQEVRDAAPGVLRLAAGAWWRTAGWTVETSAKIGSAMVGAAVSGESTGKALDKAGADARAYARRLLGLADAEGASKAADGGETGEEARQRSLRDQGAELLRQSADVNYDQGAHPAYERILSQLAPDEGRILRFLATEGPQPAVDVRSGKALIAGSQLVAPGLSMIGAQAGCRYLGRVHAYLNNLERLGLIWFSRESLEDPLRYQVLEAQPEVIEAKREAGRGRTVRRSIHLTPFGEDFCDICLPLGTAELDALPGAEAAPDEERTTSAQSAPVPPGTDPREVEQEGRSAAGEPDEA